MAGNKHLRRLLLSLEALAELGQELTAERPFSETAHILLSMSMEAVAAREGALFSFTDRPAMLTAISAQGFVNFPEQAVLPLLPKHVHALASLRAPMPLTAFSTGDYFSSNGNVAPDRMRCLAPLRVNSKLVGALGLGRRDNEAAYDEDDIYALNMLTPYVALAVQNHFLAQSLEQRISENLRLLASMHAFHDHTLEAFAAAIDVKDFRMRGHSLRVGKYAAGIGEALGFDQSEVAELRASGYLHDIGKVAVDKHLFSKPGALEPGEFKEMADHTLVGHQIVKGVEFPWKRIPDVVRWHHERGDGSGYPDGLRDPELCLPSRIVAVADCFDAMTSERPYRAPLSVGEAANQIVREAPGKLDGEAVQGLLVQIRRDAVMSAEQQTKWIRKNGNGDAPPRKLTFLESLQCMISPSDVDNLAATLNHRMNRGRVYNA